MNLIEEYNRRWQFFRDITGAAMRVHAEYKPGLLESAYEAALAYVLGQEGHRVERQVHLPIYWKGVRLEQTYRIDLTVDGVICELKAVQYVTPEHRRQLWNYLNLTHTRYGMLINFGCKQLYTEWYERDDSGHIEKVRLM